jgi:hypothetical protein
MIDGGLIGKVVKTDNTSFIGFLYPDFPFADTVMLVSYRCKPGIIYTGFAHLNDLDRGLVKNLRSVGKEATLLYSKEYLVETGIEFISTYSHDGKYDIDLTDRTVILDVVYSKWGLDYRRFLDMNMLGVLLEMEEQDFLNFAKLCWLSSEWGTDTDSVGIFSSKAVCSLINKSMEKVYATVLSINSESSVSALELSIANFIRNAKAHNYREEKKDEYNVALKTFDRNSHGKERNIAIALSKYRNMNHDKKIKLLWLIKQLKEMIKEIETNDNR